MVAVVRIVSDADLRICQIGKNEPLAGFAPLYLEARPAAFGLGHTWRGIVVTLTAATLRAHGLVVI